MHASRLLCAATAALIALTFADVARADSKNNPAPGKQGVGKRVTLTQSVAPSFHIEPLVNRFEARRGAVVPFQFELRSTGKSMEVQVLAVQLRQEESGIILHDVNAPAPSEVSFTSETEFHLDPGQTHLIRGTVTVPVAKSNFLSFGVLVRDNGQISSPEVDPNNPNKITAGVRFVTQYVLRIDIETGVKDMSGMDQLVFEHGQVKNEKGMPIAKTYLINPTNMAFECGVRGTITASTTSRPQPFRLTMKSRKNVETGERYLVRIMPKSRLLLTAPVDSLLFPGEQSLRYEVTNGRRALVDQEFGINVGSGDFPALETQLAYIGSDLSVQPAQIEIGNIKGTKRSCNLKFSNNSVSPKTIEIALRDLDGKQLDGLRLSSNKIEIRPGRTKTVRASIHGSASGSEAIFGEIRVNTSGDDAQSAQILPLAMLLGQPPAANVEVAALQSYEENGHTSFRLVVQNNGQSYVPVHADLTVADGSGTPRELADGFGRWLRPGEARELDFRPDDVLPPGDYQVRLHLTTAADAEPVERTLNITLDPEVVEPNQQDSEIAETTDVSSASA